MAGQAQPVILVTGANTGIGYEAVKALLESGKPYHVLMGSRSLEKAATAIDALKKEVPQTSSTVEAVSIDITNDDSIQAAFEAVQQKYGRLDGLVNNAGAQFEWEFREGNISQRELFNKTLDVNVTSPQMVTHIFMPLLLKSAEARLIFITSGLSSLQKTSDKFYPMPAPAPAGWPKAIGYDPIAYRSSKTALNMVMINWAWRLTQDGIKTWCVAPGFLATGLGNQADVLKARGARHPSVGGQFIRDVVEGKEDANAGKVVHTDGYVQAW